ncbi:unnamed protein product, partial [Candidula unifasciata]
VQLKQAAVIINGGIALFAGINLYRGNEKFYDEIAMPLLHFLPPETAHNLSIKLAKFKIVPRVQTLDPPSLKTVVWGRSFPNPIGLAAGFDKHAEGIDGLLKMGFGFVEVGSVTPKPQPGNPKPRLFRLDEDKAVINRYGFNSVGHDIVYHRLSQRFMQVDNPGYQQTYLTDKRNLLNIDFWTDTDMEGEETHHHHYQTHWSSVHVLNNRKHYRRKANGIVGVSLGRNTISPSPLDDYVKGVRRFGRVADYLVVNISSPSIQGLRDMHRQEELTLLLHKVKDERDNLMVTPKPALLVKISPDLSDNEKKNIADVITRPHCRVDGLIVCNTTVSRPTSLRSKLKKEPGGLSGEPLKAKALETIRDMYKLTQGQVPIIGVGGVSSGQDAYDKVKAGACLIQVYTALVFHGPPVISKIKREMAELLRRDGFNHISEAVGADTKQGQTQHESSRHEHQMLHPH